MTPTKTEQLKNLLNEVLADDQGDVIGYLDDFLTTDNNAAVLIEILEAAEKVGHPGFCRRNATDERCNECDLQDALRKWNGG